MAKLEIGEIKSGLTKYIPTDNDGLKFLEDCMETLDGLTEENQSAFWKKKYEDNDACWRQKYASRFATGPAFHPQEERQDRQDPRDDPDAIGVSDLFRRK